MLSNILKRQFSAEEQLPSFNYHVTDSIVNLEDGRISFILKAKGLPFELVSENMLENQYDSLNSLFLSIAKSTDSRLAIWCHLDHYKTKFDINYEFSFEWMKKFSQKYLEQFQDKDIFENNFYISFILKPKLGDTLEECIKELEEIKLVVNQSLRSYEIKILSTYEYKENLFSEFYEFIGYLYNGFWERIPVTSLPLRQVVASSTLHHSYRLIETRFPIGDNQFNRFRSFYDLKDFPDLTEKGKLNPTLELQFPFILCFSFTFINSADSIRMVTNKRTYSFELKQTYKKNNTTYILRFYYPDTELLKIEKEIEAKIREQKRTEQLEKLRLQKFKINTDYYWLGINKFLKPTAAFDNGRFTRLIYNHSGELPMFFKEGIDGKESLINYEIDSVDKRVIIFNEVIKKVKARLGDEVIEIINKSYILPEFNQNGTGDFESIRLEID